VNPEPRPAQITTRPCHALAGVASRTSRRVTIVGGYRPCARSVAPRGERAGVAGTRGAPGSSPRRPPLSNASALYAQYQDGGPGLDLPSKKQSGSSLFMLSTACS